MAEAQAERRRLALKTLDDITEASVADVLVPDEDNSEPLLEDELTKRWRKLRGEANDEPEEEQEEEEHNEPAADVHAHQPPVDNTWPDIAPSAPPADLVEGEANEEMEDISPNEESQDEEPAPAPADALSALAETLGLGGASAIAPPPDSKEAYPTVPVEKCVSTAIRSTVSHLTGVLPDQAYTNRQRLSESPW